MFLIELDVDPEAEVSPMERGYVAIGGPTEWFPPLRKENAIYVLPSVVELINKFCAVLDGSATIAVVEPVGGTHRFSLVRVSRKSKDVSLSCDSREVARAEQDSLREALTAVVCPFYAAIFPRFDRSHPSRGVFVELEAAIRSLHQSTGRA